jgi:hypothetical protein
MPGQRFPRPGFADSVAAAIRAAQSSGTAPAAAGAMGDGGQNPFYLPARIWQNMSPQEQEMLRQRWNRMTPEQQRRAIREMQTRDTSRFIRRAPPAPRPPAP